MIKRILVVPVNGSRVRDPFGRILPPDGRRVVPSPFWLRAVKKGFVVIDPVEEVEEVEVVERKPDVKKKTSKRKPKRGYHFRRKELKK